MYIYIYIYVYISSTRFTRCFSWILCMYVCMYLCMYVYIYVYINIYVKIHGMFVKVECVEMLFAPWWANLAGEKHTPRGKGCGWWEFQIGFWDISDTWCYTCFCLVCKRWKRLEEATRQALRLVTCEWWLICHGLWVMISINHINMMIYIYIYI
jgi:hypothetical protein